MQREGEGDSDGREHAPGKERNVETVNRKSNRKGVKKENDEKINGVSPLLRDSYMFVHFWLLCQCGKKADERGNVTVTHGKI